MGSCRVLTACLTCCLCYQNSAIEALQTSCKVTAHSHETGDVSVFLYEFLLLTLEKTGKEEGREKVKKRGRKKCVLLILFDLLQ